MCGYRRSLKNSVRKNHLAIYKDTILNSFKKVADALNNNQPLFEPPAKSMQQTSPIPGPRI